MGSGIIAPYRLCVYYSGFDEDDGFIKYFILFNTNKYFIQSLSFAYQINGNTYYLPAQIAPIPSNNSIGAMYNNTYYLYPTATNAFSTSLTVEVYITRTSSGRVVEGYTQISKGGNTVGLNYNVYVELVSSEMGNPIDDLTLSVADNWSTILWSYMNASLLPEVTICTYKISCDASADEFEFTVDYRSLPFFQTFTFDLQE